MLEMGTFLVDRIDTPIGAALLVTDAAGVLRALNFHDYEARMLRSVRLHYGGRSLIPGAAPRAFRNALRRYFEGEIAALREIEWAMAGTDFQRLVWTALTRITPGATTSYGELARKLGVARACRAVGLAPPEE